VVNLNPFDPHNSILDPFGLSSKVEDVASKDTHERLSVVLERNGWGAPASALNRQARAIVRRESGGIPTKRSGAGPCSKTGDYAYGLFQVCTVNCGIGGSPKNRDACIAFLKNADNNARVSKALYDDAGWQPWAASGGEPAPTSWDPMILTDKRTLSGDISGTVTDAVDSVVSPFSSIVSAATALIGALLSADTWFRIGKGGLGFVFLVTGTGALVFIVANKSTNGAASSAVKAAVKR